MMRKYFTIAGIHRYLLKHPLFLCSSRQAIHMSRCIDYFLNAAVMEHTMVSIMHTQLENKATSQRHSS